MDPSLYVTKAILLLDNDGNRLIAKYYDENIYSTAKEQKAFEKSLFKKTFKTNGEIIMMDNLTIVYRSNVDLHFYVIGSTNENEIILLSVLNCLVETISLILRRNVEKKYLLEYMDYVLLAVDEICDSGILLEFDPSSVLHRVCIRDTDVPIGEQTVYEVFKMAKDQFKSSLLK